MLGKPGTGYDSIDEVRADCLRGRDVSSLLSNRTQVELSRFLRSPGHSAHRDVPIYFADPLVRRSVAAAQDPDAQPPRAWMNAKLMARLGVSAGNRCWSRARQLPAAVDDRLPDECVRIAAAHPSTAQLGPMFGMVSLKKVAWRGLPRWTGRGALTSTAWNLAFIVAIVVPLLLCVAYLTLWERKLIAGSRSASPQPRRARRAAAAGRRRREAAAEGDHPSDQRNQGLFLLAPVLMLTPALAAWAVILLLPRWCSRTSTPGCCTSWR